MSGRIRLYTFPSTKQIPISHQTKHSLLSGTTSKSLNPLEEQRLRAPQSKKAGEAVL